MCVWHLRQVLLIKASPLRKSSYFFFFINLFKYYLKPLKTFYVLLFFNSHTNYSRRISGGFSFRPGPNVEICINLIIVVIFYCRYNWFYWITYCCSYNTVNASIVKKRQTEWYKINAVFRLLVKRIILRLSFHLCLFQKQKTSVTQV